MEACKSVLSSGGLHNKNRSQIKAPWSKELWVGFLQEAVVMSHSHHLWHDPSQATFMWLTASWRTRTQTLTWHEIGHKSWVNGWTIPQAGCDHRITGRQWKNICHLYLEGTGLGLSYEAVQKRERQRANAEWVDGQRRSQSVGGVGGEVFKQGANAWFWGKVNE